MKIKNINLTEEAKYKIKNITLIPGDAILFLITHATMPSEELHELKRLYLLGAHAENNHGFIDDLHSLGFKLLTDNHVINNSCVRRFFETKLAYETLKETIKSINKEDLEKHLCYLLEYIPASFHAKDYLDKNKTPFRFTPPEYINLIEDLYLNKIYHDISQIDKEKIILLVKIFIVSHSLSNNFIKLPLVEYSNQEGIKEDDARLPKEKMHSVLPYHLGLMKNFMPIPNHSEFFKSIQSPQDTKLFLPEKSKQVRLADSYNLNTKSEIAEELLKSHVDIYSGGLSGLILLTHLRIFYFLLKENKFNNTQEFKNYLQNYIKCSMSLMLHYIGSNSLAEFFYHFNTSVVKKKLKVQLIDSINLENLFFLKNNNPFDLALNATIEYNQNILTTRLMQIELQDKLFGNRKPIYFELQTLEIELITYSKFILSNAYKHLSSRISQMIYDLNDIDKEFDFNQNRTALIDIKQKMDGIKTSNKIYNELNELRNYLVALFKVQKKSKPIYNLILNELNIVLKTLEENIDLPLSSVNELLKRHINIIITEIDKKNSEYKNNLNFFKNRKKRTYLTQIKNTINQSLDMIYKKIDPTIEGDGENFSNLHKQRKKK